MTAASSPVDEWVRRVVAGERLQLRRRQYPHGTIYVRRVAGWYHVEGGWHEYRFGRSPVLVREALAGLDPADFTAEFEPYPEGLHDPFIESGWSLVFHDYDPNFPWTLTIHRLPSGRFALYEWSADCHDSMGGHMVSESRKEVDEAEARAKAELLLSRHVPSVEAVAPPAK